MKTDAAIFLGQAVERRRKALGLTQRELADLAGCSEGFLVAMEAGKSTARLDKVIDLLSTLGLELHVREGRGEITLDPGL